MIRDTELQNTDKPAIAYSTCYQQCFCSDNLDLMKTIESNTIDLIYCDILYGTGRKFKDYQDLKPNRIEIENHYIPRLKEMHRILKPTGSIYLQMDTKINHWVRCIMDDIFGYDNFLNEIVWHYVMGASSKSKYSKKHDVILLYSKSEIYKFNLNNILVPLSIETIKRSKRKKARYNIELNENNGKNPSDVFLDINPIQGNGKENINYATQKPKALIERIIKASSNEGDLVADFYAGSFTTAEVCKELNRNFIGCDINPKAVEIGRKRLNGGVS